MPSLKIFYSFLYTSIFVYPLSELKCNARDILFRQHGLWHKFGSNINKPDHHMFQWVLKLVKNVCITAWFSHNPSSWHNGARPSAYMVQVTKSYFIARQEGLMLTESYGARRLLCGSKIRHWTTHTGYQTISILFMVWYFWSNILHVNVSEFIQRTHRALRQW